MEEENFNKPVEGQENAAGTPKKRGRKPKSAEAKQSISEDNSAPQPAKRRGRPKKVKIDASESTTAGGNFASPADSSTPNGNNSADGSETVLARGPVWRDVPTEANDGVKQFYDNAEAEIFVHHDQRDDFSYAADENDSQTSSSNAENSPDDASDFDSDSSDNRDYNGKNGNSRNESDDDEIPQSFSTNDDDLIQDNYADREEDDSRDAQNPDDAQSSELHSFPSREPQSEDSARDRYRRRGDGEHYGEGERNGDDSARDGNGNERQNRWQRNNRNQNNRFQNNSNRNPNNRFQNNNRNPNNRFQGNGFQNNNRNGQQNRQNPNQRQNGNQLNRQNQRVQQNQPVVNRRAEMHKKPRWMQNQNAESDAMNPADLPDWEVLKSPAALEKFLAAAFLGKTEIAPKAENSEIDGINSQGTGVATENGDGNQSEGAADNSAQNAEESANSGSSESTDAHKIQSETESEKTEKKSVGENAEKKELSYWDLIGANSSSTGSENTAAENKPVEEDFHVEKSAGQAEATDSSASEKSAPEGAAEKDAFQAKAVFEISGVGEIDSEDDFHKIYALPIPEIQKFFDSRGIEYVKGSGKSDLVADYYRHVANREKKLVRVHGVLDAFENGFGGAIVFAEDNYDLKRSSVYVPQAFIDAFKLGRGLTVEALAMPARRGGGENCPVAVKIVSVMNEAPANAKNVVPFTDLTPYYPTRRIIMEADANSGWDNLSMRVVDLLTPIGFGQRALIVAPPRTGKTVLMQGMAKSIRRNASDAKVIVLLVDERPEEVTDFRRNVDAEVVASTFDQDASSHVHAAEMVISRARRLVEKGENVVILLDSITRLARAYNALMPNGGRTMSGGVEANALQKPKKFFGSARNIEGGGSLTIIGTALVETGSKMDEVIFEEFKGTGNLELHLDRSLSDKRIFPSINMEKSGTRKEELLYHPDELVKIYSLRRAMKGISAADAMEMLIQRLKKVKTNVEFLMGLNR